MLEPAQNSSTPASRTTDLYTILHRIRYFSACDWPGVRPGAEHADTPMNAVTRFAPLLICLAACNGESTTLLAPSPELARQFVAAGASLPSKIQSIRCAPARSILDTFRRATERPYRCRIQLASGRVVTAEYPLEMWGYRSASLANFQFEARLEAATTMLYTNHLRSDVLKPETALAVMIQMTARAAADAESAEAAPR